MAGTLAPEQQVHTKSSDNNKQRMLCRSHPDFHIPADIVVGEGFDGDALGRQLQEAGADSIAIFAKCHYGHAYYPTEIGTPHPQLKCDLLGEAVKGCNKYGVSVTAYLSVFYDSAAVAKHPEWLLQSVPGDPASSLEPDNYSPTCVNSGYIEEDLIPQSLEVINNYDVDELFYDTMTWFRPCFCQKCQDGFGKEIPANDSHPNWPTFVRWYRKCFDDAFVKITNAVKAEKPEVGVIFNWKWGVREPTPAPKGIEHLSSDYWGSGSISSYHGRYYASTGLNYDYMCGRFRHGLGEWDTTTDETLLYTASGAIANGAGYYIIDRMLPDGSLEPRAYDAMRTVFSHINERRTYLENSESIRDIAVLASYDSIIGKDLERFADMEKRSKHMKAVEGIGKILMDRGLHYTAISEEHLQAHLNDYRLLIIPEQFCVSQESLTCIEAFTKNGGHVIISLADGGEQAGLCELAGIEHQGYSEIPYSYIGGEQTFHVKQRRSVINAIDAKIRNQAKAPLVVGNARAKFGHGLAPHTDEDAGAIVSRRQLGSGTITVIACPICTAYMDNISQPSEDFILALIDEVVDPAIVQISTKARVEMSLRKNEKDLIIHLVNHSGKETKSSWVFPMLEYLPDINDIHMTIQLSGRNLRVSTCPGDENISYDMIENCASFKVPTLTSMNSIIVHDYFT